MLQPGSQRDTIEWDAGNRWAAHMRRAARPSAAH